jgi:hypothetical protein
MSTRDRLLTIRDVIVFFVIIVVGLAIVGYQS